MDNLSIKVEKAKKTPEYWAEAAKMDFADNLYLKMEEKRVSRADLARRLGVSNAYISKILNGTINFSIESMSKFAFALGYIIDINFSEKETSNVLSNTVVSIKNNSKIDKEFNWNAVKYEDQIKQKNILETNIMYEKRKSNGPADKQIAA